MKHKHVDIKMKRYNFLNGFDEIAPYLPETNYLTENTLWEFLSKYGIVIIKPVRGARGKGVMKIKAESNQLSIHFGSNETPFKTKEKAWNYIFEKIGKTQYIIQQYIPLASINNRPVDFRVMAQRIKKGPWAITGKLAKVAGPNYIITNVARSGGRILSFKEALAKSDIENMDVTKINKTVDWLALTVAERFMALYPYQHIWGMDIGIDKEGKPWLIEANVWPNIYMFKKLKDNKMYRTITDYLSHNKRRI